MITKTTHQAEAHKRIFVNAWIVTLSLLAGISVIIAAVLAGYPIFINLLHRFGG